MGEILVKFTGSKHHRYIEYRQKWFTSGRVYQLHQGDFGRLDKGDEKMHLISKLACLRRYARVWYKLRLKGSINLDLLTITIQPKGPIKAKKQQKK